MDNAIPVISATDLSKAYGDGVVTWALRGVDLKVDPGEFVAVVGASGSGKSTLLNLMGALDKPTAGRIWINGRDTSRLDEKSLAALRANTIGFVFQFHHLLDEFSILENALMPLMIRGRGILRKDIDWVKHLLKRVGLGKRMNARPNQLSGGQQQRAAIVRALANQPRLILADEPTGNLDSQNGNAVFDLLTELNSQFGIAFVVVTHDDRLAQQARRIVLIEDGQVAADYDVDSVNETAAT